MRKNFSDLALFLRRARKGVDQPNTAHAPRQTYAACCAGRGRSGSRSERRVLARRRQSGIAQLWIPIGPASLRREVEQIPLWVDGIVVAGGLPPSGRGAWGDRGPRKGGAPTPPAGRLGGGHLVALPPLAP